MRRRVTLVFHCKRSFLVFDKYNILKYIMRLLALEQEVAYVLSIIVDGDYLTHHYSLGSP